MKSLALIISCILLSCPLWAQTLFRAGQGQLPELATPIPVATSNPPVATNIVTPQPLPGQWQARFGNGQGRLQINNGSTALASASIATGSTEISPQRWRQQMMQSGNMRSTAQDKAAVLSIRPAFDHGRLFLSDYFYRLAGSALSAQLSPQQLMAAGELSALYHLPDAHQQRLPEHFLRVEGNYAEILVADLENAQLRLYQRDGSGEHQLIRHYFTSYGLSGWEKWLEGDNRTPVGLYFTQWLIPGSNLPDLYGYGALPINYPSVWDTHLQRTGYGIWLHGNDPVAGLRLRETTNGCLAVSNEDMAEIVHLLNTRSAPILIVDNTASALPEAMTVALEQKFDQWLASQPADRDPFYRIDPDIVHRVQDANVIRISNQLMVAWEDAGYQVAVVNYTDLRDGRHWRQYWRFDRDLGWIIFFEGRVTANFS